MVTGNKEERAEKGLKKAEKRVNDTLSGMKAICDYVHRSEPTVLSMVRSYGFPAKKVGGIWESSRSLIDEWKLTN
jgi:hypothetical protein